jgi:hypothetical protein
MTTGNAEGEHPLGGGQLSHVVRVGDTVRRSTGPWTPAVHSLLAHLERAGYRGAPRVLGIDDRKREILSFVPGEVPAPDGPPPYVWADAALAGAARLLRRYHDAVAEFVSEMIAVERAIAETLSHEIGHLACISGEP